MSSGVALERLSRARMRRTRSARRVDAG
jgi:hypothetical protein